MQEIKDKGAAYKPFNLERAKAGDKLLVLGCIAEYKFSYLAKEIRIGEIEFHVFVGKETNNSSHQSHRTLTLTEEELNNWAVMLPQKTKYYMVSWQSKNGEEGYRHTSSLYVDKERLLTAHYYMKERYIIHEIEIEE